MLQQTAAHEEHVAQRVIQISTYLGLELSHTGEIQLAALLHDVGKIGIPVEIMNKTVSLTRDEFAVIRSHSILGWNIVNWTGMRHIGVWIRHHHERWDGGGYPDGLAGEQIPLESRMIFVADTFDALTSNRPYRRGRSGDEAMHEIELHSGTQFDPTCVDALKAVYAKPRI